MGLVTYRRSRGIGGSELAKVVGVIRGPVTKQRPHENAAAFLKRKIAEEKEQ